MGTILLKKWLTFELEKEEYLDGKERVTKMPW